MSSSTLYVLNSKEHDDMMNLILYIMCIIDMYVHELCKLCDKNHHNSLCPGIICIVNPNIQGFLLSIGTIFYLPMFGVITYILYAKNT